MELGQQLGDLRARYSHMDIFGGCCGTGHVHLREIARALAFTGENAAARNEPAV